MRVCGLLLLTTLLVGCTRAHYRLSADREVYPIVAERSRFDITDNISFITEATYAKVHASTGIEPFPLDSVNINPVDASIPIQVTPGGACNPFDTLGGALACPASNPCEGTGGNLRCRLSICNDGLDNDGDGKADKMDLVCSGK